VTNNVNIFINYAARVEWCAGCVLLSSLDFRDDVTKYVCGVIVCDKIMLWCSSLFNLGHGLGVPIQVLGRHLPKDGLGTVRQGTP